MQQCVLSLQKNVTLLHYVTLLSQQKLLSNRMEFDPIFKSSLNLHSCFTALMLVSRRLQSPSLQGQHLELKGWGESVSSHSQNTSQLSPPFLLQLHSRQSSLLPLLPTERKTKMGRKCESTVKKTAETFIFATDEYKYATRWFV